MSNISAFGKVPTHGDFVRQNASARAVRVFEDWLQKGLFYMKTLRRPDLDAAYDASPPIAFLFRGGSGDGLLTGVLQASRDGAGRRYPLVVAAELTPSSPPASTSSLIVSQGGFYDAAVNLAGAAASGSMGHREFMDQVTNDLPRLVHRGNGQVPENHIRYMSQTTLGNLGQALWRHFEASDKYFLFKNLLDVAASLSPDGARSAGFGLRFPVQPVEATSSSSFWLSVCERLLHTLLSDVTLFWSMSGTTQNGDWPGSPFLLVFFEPPPPRILADIFAGRAMSETVFDLQDGSGAQGAEVALSIPSRLGQLLEVESNSLSDFVLMLGAHGAAPDHPTIQP